jgi:L-aminopeptidase/D-esterase-like protein
VKGLTDIDGIRVGHASDFDGLTGCTVVLCDKGAVGGVDVRGSATGTVELGLLEPDHVTDRINAVVLAGGSAYGLEASAGVRRFLGAKGIGFPTGVKPVPLVPGAILFDLGIGKPVWPSREMGEAAVAAATDDAVQEGCVGAGTGASVGKLFGMSRAMKGGIGSATVWLDGPYAGVRVSALAAVNALGDVVDPDTGRVVAGARESAGSRNFVDSVAQIKAGARGGFRRENTTLVVVATNARLDRVGANKLAELANAGMARAIRPVWTQADGDVLFALSCGEERCDLTALGVAGAEAVAGAIVRAVRAAHTMGGVPGLASVAG